MSASAKLGRSDADRAEMSARQSAAQSARHQRRRDAGLVELLAWPDGAGPLPTLPEAILWALVKRGLVEIRFHLTPEGRRQAETLREAKP